ncbi:methyl-accepting chemotaxis protein [Halomonas sp. HL-93]|uniref:methyl-accepting chemotaxis protein n=1 Tax=Halomonas sp. HL-93 TaxID=1666906 RepID=UPI0006D971C9|nr:methyl-accepting chemotaxis protein [Halomonas sp. HL-93]KPQ19125.1 MAG: chemotaxis signal relay system methyl-accepting signal transducer [Halomonas sp. HL-93]SBR47510.1 methyl-accepting chemotaxis sensory transducer with Pas/Pac sensor [Halomonas sp. HL-93]
MQDAYSIASQPLELSDDEVLISRSDLEGNITYANQALIDVSGYSLNDMIGAPHRLFRHPDMPSEVFKNLWTTLERGRTWQGVIKNRCQNGRGYWVHTTIAPLLDGERVVGYTSIRRKATDAAIAKAEKVYARMQTGRMRGFTLHDGAIKRSGVIGWGQRFSFRSMQAKLIGMVLAAVVLLVIGGIAGVYGVTSSADRLRTLNQTGLEGIADLQRVEQRVSQAIQALEPAVSNPRRSDLDTLETQLADNRRDIEDVLQRVDASAEENEVEQALVTYLTQFMDAIDTTFSAIRDANGFAAFEAFNDNVQPTSERISSTVNQLVAQEREAAQALMASAERQQNTLLYTQLGVLLLGIVILVTLSTAVLRSLIKSLNEARRVTFQIAAGNLANRVTLKRKDELGELLGSLETMRASLSGLITDVGAKVEVVTPASQQIYQENEALATRTEQQASSLQQTASSMDELTATVQQNTENARQANQLATQNAATSRETGERMEALVSRMERIASSAEKMTDIIGVIDGIAFQTNILALNASVEAARAGEQGRGFAVVANEVRSLAGRSADAAGEIRRLIEASSQEISGGTSAVKDAEQAIERVVTQVMKVSDIMAEINTASDEQSSGIAQINSAVAEMDHVTQQNATRVQSVSGAAQQLTRQALELANVIAAFRLEGANEENTQSARGRLAGTQLSEGLPPLASSSLAMLQRAEAAEHDQDAKVVF